MRDPSSTQAECGRPDVPNWQSDRCRGGARHPTLGRPAHRAQMRKARRGQDKHARPLSPHSEHVVGRRSFARLCHDMGAGPALNRNRLTCASHRVKQINSRAYSDPRLVHSRRTLLSCQTDRRNILKESRASAATGAAPTDIEPARYSRA
jgi:hypothetical protein